MIDKEQHAFSYNLGLIALMNGIIALSFASCKSPLTPAINPNKQYCYLYKHTVSVNSACNKQ